MQHCHSVQMVFLLMRVPTCAPSGRPLTLHCQTRLAGVFDERKTLLVACFSAASSRTVSDVVAVFRGAANCEHLSLLERYIYQMVKA